MTSGCIGAHGPGMRYTYAELEGLWIQAGGSRSLAPVMAAIAEAESGGCSSAANPSGASGLWQILGVPFPGNVWDPLTNAKMAVAKYKSQGLGAWATYTNGAYKQFLNSKTTPANPRGGPVPGGTAAGGAAGAAGPAGPQTGAGCLLANPFSASLPLVGNISAGPSCLLSTSNVRAWAGGFMMLAGGLVAIGGLVVLAAAGFRRSGALGKAADVVGVIPGPQSQAAAAGLRTAQGRVKGQRPRGPSRRQVKAREDAAMERVFGPGPDAESQTLRTGRGAVRELPAETRRRKQLTAAERAADKPPF